MARTKARAGNKRFATGNGFFSDLFKPTVYRPGATKSATSAAYRAGKESGDTGEFESWWSNYRNKTGVNKAKAKREYERGVEGEPSTEKVVAKKATGIRGKYRGCNIYFDPKSKEFFSACDRDSKFDSYQEAKKHVDYVKDKLRKNPGLFERTPKEITEGFHGRESTDETEILEEEIYPDELAGLGLLVELEICDSQDSDKVVPIKFNYSKAEDAVILACDREGNIEFVGGDQDLELGDLEAKLGELPKEKAKVKLGYVYTISYFSDKFHLEGPKYQEKGTEYIHQFAEEGGELPCLIYDFRNKKMELVGGSYVISDEGIRN